MAARSVLILAAMQMEANAVADALGVGRPSPNAPGEGVVVAGGVGGVEVRMGLIGIGAGALPEGVGREPGMVILAGLSAGLDPSLRVGDIVVEGLADQVRLPRPHRRGKVASGELGGAGAAGVGANVVLSTAEQKAEWFARTGALAFDMESGIVRRWAEARGWPLVVVRAISDRADQAVDPQVMRWVDEWGRPRIGAVVEAVIRRPGVVRTLWRLGADSKLAAKNLGAAVREIVLGELCHSTE